MEFLRLFAIAALLGIAIHIIIARKRSQPAKNYPPGPPTLPFVGNLHQIPRDKAYLTFQQWTRTYGAASDGLIMLHLGPTAKLLVLNTARQVSALLEDRGTIYSGRMVPPLKDAMRHWRDPTVPFTNEFFFDQYDDDYRRYRRAAVDNLRSGVVEKLLPVQDKETNQMIWELMTRDEAVSHHGMVKRLFGAVILDTVYGIRGKQARRGTPLGDFADMMQEYVELVIPNSAPPIDVFPWIQHIPRVLSPWRRWMNQARVFCDRYQRFNADLYRASVDKQTANGGLGETGFLAKLVEQGFSTEDVLSVGANLLQGGADTTASTCLIFILAMAAHPEVQKKAQEELDGVFGDSMPSYEDWDRLPFLRACYLETIRFHPVIPLNMRKTSADDVYSGYFIPRGTNVLINTWALLHDPNLFPEPEEFLPSRFLDAGQPSAAKKKSTYLRAYVTYAFGAGRRICPGQRMAENSLMLAMAKLLWAFEILPGDKGVDLDVKTAFRGGMVEAPREQEVRFRVRGEVREEVVRREWRAADEFLSRYE